MDKEKIKENSFGNIKTVCIFAIPKDDGAFSPVHLKSEKMKLSVENIKTNKDFENFCNSIENEELRKKALNIVWYSMTLKQDITMLKDLLGIK